MPSSYQYPKQHRNFQEHPLYELLFPYDDPEELNMLECYNKKFNTLDLVILRCVLSSI